MWVTGTTYEIGDNIRIRPMERRDVEQLQAKVAALDDEDKYVLRRGDLEWDKKIDYCISHVERMHVIERWGDIMGCFSVIPLTQGGVSGEFLDMIVIFPEYRGRGFCYACVEYVCFRYCHENCPCCAITLAGELKCNSMLKRSLFTSKPMEGKEGLLVWERHY